MIELFSLYFQNFKYSTYQIYSNMETLAANNKNK